MRAEGIFRPGRGDPDFPIFPEGKWFVKTARPKDGFRKPPLRPHLARGQGARDAAEIRAQGASESLEEAFVNLIRRRLAA